MHVTAMFVTIIGVFIKGGQAVCGSLMPRPTHRREGSGDIRAFSWLCCVSST